MPRKAPAAATRPIPPTAARSKRAAVFSQLYRLPEIIERGIGGCKGKRERLRSATGMAPVNPLTRQVDFRPAGIEDAELPDSPLAVGILAEGQFQHAEVGRILRPGSETSPGFGVAAAGDGEFVGREADVRIPEFNAARLHG